MSEVAERFRRSSQRFTDCVLEVKSSDWATSTTCEGWTAADIVKHVVETEANLLTRMPFAPTPALDVSDSLSALSTVGTTVQAALDDASHADHGYDGYFGPTTFAATVDRFYTVDLMVHRWDLAHSVGLATHAKLDDDELDHIESSLAGLGDDLRQPGLFGPEIAVADGASRQTKVLAYIGRTA